MKKSKKVLNLEGELHGELRGLVAKAFLPRSVQKLVPFMEKKSSDLLSEVDHKEFDLLKDYAQPYSISVIGQLLGVPEEQYDNFLHWSNCIVKMYDLKVSSKDGEEAAHAARDFYEYIYNLIDEKIEEYHKNLNKKTG